LIIKQLEEDTISYQLCCLYY